MVRLSIEDLSFSQLFVSPMSVGVFLGLHFVEDLGRCRIVIPQTRCEVDMDSPVHFLVGNS